MSFSSGVGHFALRRAFFRFHLSLVLLGDRLSQPLSSVGQRPHKCIQVYFHPHRQWLVSECLFRIVKILWIAAFFSHLTYSSNKSHANILGIRLARGGERQLTLWLAQPLI